MGTGATDQITAFPVSWVGPPFIYHPQVPPSFYTFSPDPQSGLGPTCIATAPESPSPIPTLQDFLQHSLAPKLRAQLGVHVRAHVHTHSLCTVGCIPAPLDP